VTEKSVTFTAKLCPASRRLVVETDSTGGPSGREAAALLAAVRATAKLLASEIGCQAGVGEAVTEMMLGHEGESEYRMTHGQLRVHTQRL
jgi:hypothetical protein